MACTLVLLAACADKPTAPTSQFEKVAGRPANQIAAFLASVTPSPATVKVGATQQFTAIDNFGATMVATSLTWSVSGGGTVAGSGLFTAGPTAGTLTLTVFDPNASVTVLVPITVTVSSCKTGDDNRGDGRAGDGRNGDDTQDCDKQKNDDKNKDKDHQNKDKGGDRG
jgi:hypothetical protein